jgi:hypothetical protein
LFTSVSENFFVRIGVVFVIQNKMCIFLKLYLTFTTMNVGTVTTVFRIVCLCLTLTNLNVGTVTTRFRIVYLCLTLINLNVGTVTTGFKTVFFISDIN